MIEIPESSLSSVKQKFRIFSRHWPFFISLVALMCLEMQGSVQNIAAILLSLLIWFVYAEKCDNVFALAGRVNLTGRIYAAVTALGFCWHGAVRFGSSYYASYRIVSRIMNEISRVIGGYVTGADVTSFALALCAGYAAFVLCCGFWEAMREILADREIYTNLKRKELAFYGMILAGTLIYVTFAFAHCDVFYSSKPKLDIVYTFDTPYIYGDAYLEVAHRANDFRQLLFSIASAPLLGGAYTAGKLLRFIPNAIPLLSNYCQVALLLVGNYLIASAVTQNPMKRAAIVGISVFSYPYLLFTLAMDQYLIAYFWLAFMVYQLCRKEKVDLLVFLCACGTLVTSAALTVWISSVSSVRKIGSWCLDMLRMAWVFILSILICCRLGEILSLKSFLETMALFSGAVIPIKERFFQFVAMVSATFFAPDAGPMQLYEDLVNWLTGFDANFADLYVNTLYGWGLQDHMAWELQHACAGHLALGGIILMLAAAGLIVNRKKKVYQIAGFWAVFSFFVTVVVGWGAVENGMVLYTLYFGWAYWVLIFGLADWIGEKLRLPRLSIGAAAAFAAASLVYNFPAIAEMLQFLFTNYPV